MHQILPRDLISSVGCNTPTDHMVSPTQGAKKSPYLELNTNAAPFQFSAAPPSSPNGLYQSGPYELLGPSINYNYVRQQNMSMDRVQGSQTSFATPTIVDSSSGFGIPIAAQPLSIPSNVIPLDVPGFCPTVWHPILVKEHPQFSDARYLPTTLPIGGEALPNQALFYQRTPMAYDVENSMGTSPHRAGGEEFRQNIFVDTSWGRAKASAQPDPNFGSSYSKDSWALPIKCWLPELFLQIWWKFSLQYCIFIKERQWYW